MSHLAWRKWYEAWGSCSNWGQSLVCSSDRNHYNHQCGHEKIFHTAREGLLESRAQKSVSGRGKKGPGRLLTDTLKYQWFHFYHLSWSETRQTPGLDNYAKNQNHNFKWSWNLDDCLLLGKQMCSMNHQNTIMLNLKYNWTEKSHSN